MGEAVTVRRLDDAGCVQWDAYCARAGQAGFFHRSGWRAIMDGVFGHRAHYLYAERAGVITGILPLAHVRSRLFANALVSVPFLVHAGVVADDVESRTALERAAIDLAHDLGVDYLELREREPVECDWPRREGLYAWFAREIAADDETNLMAIPRKQRAMVRKGIGNGLVDVIDSDPARLYRCYSESLRNLGTPMFSRHYFPDLLETFGGQAEVLTVEHRGRALAAVLSFYHRDSVLPYYGGGVAAARELKAADFMYWRLLSRAAERGVREFDYGRSKLGSGSYSFKKNWGFEPRPLAYRYQLVRARELPDTNPNNPRYRRFIAAWKHLPLAVANRVGPVIVRQTTG